MKVLFLHGLESLPGGDKAKSLVAEGIRSIESFTYQRALMLSR